MTGTPEWDQGTLKRPEAPSLTPQRPAPGTNNGSGNKRRRPVKYPIQMRVYINPAMLASLQRICRRLGIPEGIGARIAITQFLAHQDPHYKGE